MGEEWMDAKKLTDEDNLYESLKHGTLSIGFIGLLINLEDYSYVLVNGGFKLY